MPSFVIAETGKESLPATIAPDGHLLGSSDSQGRYSKIFVGFFGWTFQTN